MEDLLKTFIIPDNTSMEEHSIVVDGDAIIGNHSELGFGIIASSVIVGERVRINGNVIGTEEVRIDMWSQIGGNIKTKNDAYIGEFVNIDGKLIVEGDLDIGKDVKIKGGFEARGWIVVRNPIPVFIYVFLYLTELLRMGKDEEVEKAMEELFAEDDELETDTLFVVPSGSKIDLESIRVPDKAVIGSGCRMMGNIRASSLDMMDNNTLFGSIKTENGIKVGENNIIHGDLVTRGDVRVYKGTHIMGEINGGKIYIHEEARVDGAMRAPGGVIISRGLMEEEERPGGILDVVPTIKSSSQKMAEKSGETTAAGIPSKRMITAVRVPELNKLDVDKNKPAIKKTAAKTKSTAKKPEALKSTYKKTAAKKKSATKKTTAKQKSTEKK
ncbi:MAG TPA: acyltransferase [archaeon]|nr:acyltransferase [archaeon]